MKRRKLLIISTILAGFGIIFLIFQYSASLYELESDIGTVTPEALDYIVNSSIVRCETKGELCETMHGWLEICKNAPEYKDVTSCHDGRIEQLIETSHQNYINVEKNSPPIEITGTIDFQPFEAEFFFDPDPDEMYKIEHTGKNKAFLVSSFIDPTKGTIPRDFDGKHVRITGVLVNDDPEYGKPEKTYDAIIIVQIIEVLN